MIREEGKMEEEVDLKEDLGNWKEGGVDWEEGVGCVG